MKESFGIFLKDQRKKNRMTQTDLAYHLRIDAARLSRIENGKIFLDKNKISLLSELFKIETSTIRKQYFGDKIARTIYENNCSLSVLSIAEDIYNQYKKSPKSC